MEEKLYSEKLQIQERAEEIKEKAGSYRECKYHYEQLKQRVQELKRMGETKMRQIEQLNTSTAKESDAIHQGYIKLQKIRFDGDQRRVEECSRSMTISTEKMERLEKITPYVLDNGLLENALQQRRNRVTVLEKACFEKRAELHHKQRMWMEDYYDMAEHMHIMTDLQWEFFQMKKEEERALQHMQMGWMGYPYQKPSLSQSFSGANLPL